MTLTAAIVAFVNAALALVVNFGVSLTETQVGSITVLVNAAIVLVTLVNDKRTKRTLTPPPPGSANGPTGG